MGGGSLGLGKLDSRRIDLGTVSILSCGPGSSWDSGVSIARVYCRRYRTYDGLSSSEGREGKHRQHLCRGCLRNRQNSSASTFQWIVTFEIIVGFRNVKWEPRVVKHWKSGTVNNASIMRGGVTIKEFEDQNLVLICEHGWNKDLSQSVICKCSLLCLPFLFI